MSAAKKTNTKLDALLSVVEQSIFFLDADGKVTSSSVGAASWLDITKIEGKQLTEIFPEDLAEPLARQLDQALTAGNPVMAEYQLRPEHLPVWKDAGLKESKWFRVIFASDGEKGAVWSMQDISQEKRLARQVTSQAQRDSLTGAYNRRALMPVLSQSIAQAQRYDWICSVMIIDIDNFSDINDKHSWDCGDQLLQQLVASLHRMKRTSDFLARYGDDQIAMFMPETNMEQGAAAAERVRKLAAEMEIPYATGDIHYTVSIGVTSLDGVEDTSVDMLKRAEENLFVAKQTGGNRTQGDD